jgi:hypothetical protein
LLELSNIHENLPGTRATFACDANNELVGSSTTICLTSGNWSKDPATCKVVDYGTQGNPATTCKAAYDYLVDRLVSVQSGPYWLKPAAVREPFEVWCDMETKTKDGKSGWTLCGKYDRERAGARYSFSSSLLFLFLFLFVLVLFVE